MSEPTEQTQTPEERKAILVKGLQGIMEYHDIAKKQIEELAAFLESTETPTAVIEQLIEHLVYLNRKYTA
tara:strand:+ start:2014 stop:2223 length:210 start_codon:yes stop_codon:yes gene_type:complete